MKICRALISVFDKNGVADFAHALEQQGVEIISTGGTASLLRQAGIKVRGISSFTDFFLIVTGANRRQAQAISDEIVDQLKRHGSPAARVEGYQNAEWILVDYGDFVVHVFDEKARRFYDLERLWREARRLDVSQDDLTRLSSLREK